MRFAPIILLLSAPLLRAEDPHSVRTFEHKEVVRPVAFAPDGKTLATGCYDKKARLWDPATGEMRRELGVGHAILSMAFAPNGKRIAVGTYQGELAIFQVESGKKLVNVTSGRGNISWLAWSPDGATLATADYEATVTLWDTLTGKPRMRLSGHQPRAWAVAFSPDGSVLASGGEDSLIRLWDPKTGKETGQLRGHTNGIGGLAFSRDGRHLVSASADGSFRVWEILSGQEVLGMFGPTPHAVVFSPDDRLILGATHDNHVYLWDSVSGTELTKLDGHRTWVLGIGFSPDGKKIISSSQDKTARLWKIDDLPPARKEVRLTDREREQHWTALAGFDARKTYQSMRALANDPTTPAFLEKHLKPVPALTNEQKKTKQARIGEWIEKLDANEAADRDRATAELELLGELALPALRRANEKATSLEMLTRTAVLIDRCESLRSGTGARQELRAVAVLEWLGGEKAKSLLKKLTNGNPEAALTREVKASLARLP
jgi:hypothetical protein